MQLRKVFNECSDWSVEEKMSHWETIFILDLQKGLLPDPTPTEEMEVQTNAGQNKEDGAQVDLSKNETDVKGKCDHILNNL